jgi:ABC-type branched-subunit amino acid transport system permease subunit
MVATIGLSEVLLALTALPFIRPHNLYKPVPVPFDLSFTVGTVLITPSEVLTLIVAPLVVAALVVAVRWTPWGLSMRAMSENADSARLSGVWVRRTSTLTWIVAGALSAFNAILLAPGQTSALVQAVSPDLLLFALTAALVGAMVNLTVAFVAGTWGIYQVLQWNFLNAEQHGERAGVLRRAASRDADQGGAFERPVVPSELDLAAGRSRSGARSTSCDNALDLGTGRGRGGAPASCSTWTQLSLRPGLHLCHHCALLHRAHRLGRPGVAGSNGLVAVGSPAAHLENSIPLPVLLLSPALVTGSAIIVGLPALRSGLFLAVSTLGFALFMRVTVVAHRASPCPSSAGALWGRRDTTVVTNRTVRPQPVVAAGRRLVHPGCSSSRSGRAHVA